MFLSSDNENDEVNLSNFEILGKIVEIENFCVNIPQSKTLDSSIDFPYQKNDHQGLFSYFLNFSMKQRNEIFEIWSGFSDEGQLTDVLTIWDQKCWQSFDFNGNPWFCISFKKPWRMKITGYRLMFGNDNYPRTWEFRKFYGNVLHLQKNSLQISQPFHELSFEISTSDFFSSISFYFRR